MGGGSHPSTATWPYFSSGLPQPGRKKTKKPSLGSTDAGKFGQAPPRQGRRAVRPRPQHRSAANESRSKATSASRGGRTVGQLAQLLRDPSPVTVVGPQRYPRASPGDYLAAEQPDPLAGVCHPGNSRSGLGVKLMNAERVNCPHFRATRIRILSCSAHRLAATRPAGGKPNISRPGRLAHRIT